MDKGGYWNQEKREQHHEPLLLAVFSFIFDELFENQLGINSTDNSQAYDQKIVCWSNSLIPVLTKSTGLLKMSTVSVLLDQL